MKSRKLIFAAALMLAVGLVLFFLWKQNTAERGAKSLDDRTPAGHDDLTPKIAEGIHAPSSKTGKKSLDETEDTPPPEDDGVGPGVLMDNATGELTLSEGSGVDAATVAKLNALVKTAFARLEEIDARHAEVVSSNLRTDVIIIGKAGEEGQKIKTELERGILQILPKDSQAFAKLIVKEVGQSTADFGSKFRAIYTQPNEAGFKFTIGGFNDVMVKDFESFKKGETYRDASNASSSVSFTAPSPPFYLKKYFAQ